MYEIDIFGSCVTRDVFEYDELKMLEVREYISRCSLFSSVSIPALYDPNWENEKVPIWGWKCIRTDFTKDVFKRLENSKAQLLIIDFIDERHKLLGLQNGSLVTDSVYLQDSQIMEQNVSYKDVMTDTMTKAEKEKCVKLFAENVKRIYEPEQVVINKAFCVDTYLDCKGKVHDFSEKIQQRNTVINARIAYLYDELMLNLPGCKVLDMPEKISADEANKWGLAPFHYERKYYQTRILQIQKICEDKKKFRM